MRVISEDSRRVVPLRVLPLLACCAGCATLLQAAASTLGVVPPAVTLERAGVRTPVVDARTALAGAQPGDVVLLGPGTHRGPLVVTTAQVTLRGDPGARINANDPDWTPRWDKAPQFGRLAYASAIPFEPGTVSVDDRVMIDAREARGGLVLHDRGLDEDSRVPLQGVFTYLAREKRLIVSFPDGSAPSSRRIEASPAGTAAVAVRGADTCHIERLIITGGETGIVLENTRGTRVDHCLVYSVDTGVLLGVGAASCRIDSCDLTMNPDALNLDCDQISVGKAVWHAHKHAGTYDKRCVLAEKAGSSNEVAFCYLYNMWDGVENGSGVGREDVAEHYSNQVFKGIALYNRGLKVHHNRLDLAMDDALESGEELVDNQWFANVITRARCAARLKTIALGPFYFYDNVLLDSGNGLRLYKSSPPCAAVFIFNNLVRHKTGIIYHQMGDVCWSDPWLARAIPRGTPGFRIFNNVFICATPFANYEGSVTPNFAADFNLYTARAAAAYPTNGLERHSLFGAVPRFADVTNGNWRLTSDSPGKGAGGPLPLDGVTPPPELAARLAGTGADLGPSGMSGAETPRGPVSGLWDLARRTINLGERDVASFSLSPTPLTPLKPLWGRGAPGTGPLDPPPAARPPAPRLGAAPAPVAAGALGPVPVDILRNGTFTQVFGNGTPDAWRLYGAATLRLEENEDDHRLVVTTTQVSPDPGSLTQVLTGLPPDTRLVFSGTVRGSKENLARLQIKLKDGKREIARFVSDPAGTAETELRVACATSNATSISVECRYSQAAVGDRIWISNLKLSASRR